MRLAIVSGMLLLIVLAATLVWQNHQAAAELRADKAAKRATQTQVCEDRATEQDKYYDQLDAFDKAAAHKYRVAECLKAGGQ